MKLATSRLLLGLTVLILLSGCTTATKGAAVDETLDVYGAKAIAQSIENELAGYIPASSVASTEQLNEGILYSCDADGIYQWTGHNYVTLSSLVDDKKIVDEVVAGFGDRPPFSALADTTHDGAPSAVVMGPAGSTYLLTLSVDRSRIEIFSFSPCFRLPDDMSPFAEY